MISRASPRFLRALACASAFAFSGSQALMIALYPLLAETLGLHLSTLIASFGMGSFLFIFAGPYWARKSDRFGRGRILAVGLLGLAVSLALTAVPASAPFSSGGINLALLLMSRAVYGLVASSLSPVAQSLQADLAGDEGAAKGMILHSMSLSLGRVVGLALIVGFHSSSSSLLWAAAAVASVVLIAALMSPTPEQSLAVSTVIPSWRQGLVSSRGILALAFIFTTFVELLNSSLAGSVKMIFDLSSLSSAGLTARLLLMASLGIFAVQALARVFAKAEFRWGLLIGAGSLLAGAVVFAAASTLPQLWTAIGFFVVGIGLLPPFYLTALRAQGEKDSYGQRAGLAGSAQTLGFVAGAMAAALLFRFPGLQIGPGLIFLSLVLVLLSYRQTSRTMSPVEAS